MKITVRPITEMNRSGRSYVAIDESGEVIADHYCSNDSFAKSDLGVESLPDESHMFNKRRELYKSKYPDGFTVEFDPTVLNLT